MPRRTVALCLDKLGHIAVDYGFRTAADLYRCSIQWLSRWARIITAHDGFIGSGPARRPLVGGAALDGVEARVGDDGGGWFGVRPSVVALGVTSQRCSSLQSRRLP